MQQFLIISSAQLPERLARDLSVRGVTAAQIDKVVPWVVARGGTVVARAEVETALRDMGFAPEEAKDVLVSIVKAGVVLPRMGLYLVLGLIGLASLIFLLTKLF